MWEESDREALGIAILHSLGCEGLQGRLKGQGKAVRFLTVPSFPMSPGLTCVMIPTQSKEPVHIRPSRATFLA